MGANVFPTPFSGIQETLVDAKGDLIAATAADTPARLAVGTTEHRLVAASGEATGLKYVADTTNYAVAAKGDLLVGTAADTLAALTVGANGTTLVADSSTATGLKWVTPAGGGKVLQVVQVSNTTDTTVASESYTDTGLSGSITPSSTSSKILVQYAQQVRATRTGNQLGIMTKLLRSSTTIYEPAGTGFSWFLNNDPIEVYFTVVGLYLDSPNTTSATTYKRQDAKQLQYLMHHFFFSLILVKQ
jgi:hypothetical protein